MGVRDFLDHSSARIDREPEYRGGFVLASSNEIGRVCEDWFVRYSVAIAIANEETSWEQPFSSVTAHGRQVGHGRKCIR
jgi:hypothetical protein